MQKTLILSLVLVAVLLSLVRLSVTQSQIDVKEIATPVTKGVMSEKQKEHSKLYSAYRKTTKLPDLTRQQGGNQNQEVNISILPAIPELATSGAGTASDALEKLAAKADVVVIATAINKTSQITEDETFVFTDYDLSVIEVLKDSPSVQPQSVITVTRPGGKILLEGRVINVRDRSFEPLAIGGKFLLFLRYIPATGSYQAVNDQSSFEVVKNNVRPLSGAPDAKNQSGEAGTFLSEVRAAIAKAQ